uniref:Uncharacterized protein n=1 Tax=viral metagenome TaxID=1070528 RepID=A0A6M3JR17_9ZZZZ
MPENEEEFSYGKQSSVVVNHNSKGFTWSIKFYYNDQETTQDEVVEYIKELDNKLKARFE